MKRKAVLRLQLLFILGLLIALASMSGAVLAQDGISENIGVHAFPRRYAFNGSAIHAVRRYQHRLQCL